MTLQITLPRELEERLQQQAQRLRLSPDVLTIKLLEEHLPPAVRSAAAIGLLQQWINEDEVMTEEERGGNASVLRALDEDRLSDRKLFSDLINDEPE
jgi:hypothetical protein